MLKHTFKNKLMIALLVLSLSLTSIVFGEVEGSENETAASFVVFYEHITDENIEFLASYDLAVLEPKGSSKVYNDYLQASGTEIYGYMSTLEVERYDDFKISRLNENDYLYVDGNKVYIEKYDDYLGDIRSKDFRTVLLDTIEDRIVNAGYDGVFLDTVDFTEYFEDEKLNLELQYAYIEFLDELKVRFPNLKVFQNRGFESFELGSAQYIDYLLYEDFRSDKINTSEYYSNLVNRLNNIATKNNVTVAALSQRDEVENNLLANKLNWSYYFNSYEDNYLKLSNKKINNDEMIEVKEDVDSLMLNDLTYTLSEEMYRMKMFLVSESDVRQYGLMDAVVVDENNNAVLIYNKYLMDINHDLYINYLNNNFEEAINNDEQIFKLTYVTSAEKVEENWSTDFESQLSGYVNYIKNLKSLYPSIELIQERGLDYLSNDLAEVIDGIYWNGFEFEEFTTSKWLQNKVDDLAIYQNNFDWKVILEN